MSKKTIGSSLRFTSLVMIICLLLGGVAGFELWIIRKNEKAKREKTPTTAKEQVGPLTGDTEQESGNNVTPTLEPWDHAYWWEYGLTEEDIHERWWWKENPTMNESEIMYFLQNEDRLEEERRRMLEQGIMRTKTLYEQAYEKATEEQKRRLENIEMEEKEYGVSGRDRNTYIKQIKTIMGEISADTPYISLEQAKRICREFQCGTNKDEDFARITAEFNKIAGAPDIDGGSGFRILWYYIDEKHDGYITIGNGAVIPSTFVLYKDSGGAVIDLLLWTPENGEKTKDLYELAFEKATEDDRKQLEGIAVDYNTSATERSSYVREIKTIIGELPSSMPRISFDQAKRICESVDTNMEPEEIINWVTEEFNKIAGAPDIDGGSKNRILWYINFLI